MIILNIHSKQVYWFIIETDSALLRHIQSKTPGGSPVAVSHHANVFKYKGPGRTDLALTLI